MKVLLKGEMIVDSDYTIGQGFVGIDGGQVSYVGQDQPEAFDDVELFVGGEGRVIHPGLAALGVYPVFFPFRYRVPTGKVNVNEVIRSMSRSDAYYFSLLAGYRLMKKGVTTVLINGPFLDQAGRAMKSLGLRVVVLAHIGCDREEWGTYGSLRERWGSEGTSLAIDVCGRESLKEALELAEAGGHTIFVERWVDLSGLKRGGRRVVAMGGGFRCDLDSVKSHGLGLTFVPSYEVYKFSLGEMRPSISLESSPQMSVIHEAGVAVSRYLLKADEAFSSITRWPHEQLGIQGGSLEVGKLGDAVVLNFHDSLTYPIDPLASREMVIFSEAEAETVVVGGEVVLDGGIPISGDPADLEKAESKIREFGRASG
ncbi:amidohydrolase [Sulfodiicoccus acidiphilus]|uniref:Amidohydrolase n=1 Tax=Sulfodiicoccus acidiphilus TaxID=1670455 RepID=A0A348B3M2_9CREN|nr:amidohydrolase family protein [Sulfodiicoccus acidiphilus]BBD72774.1 amidohydrolase [Sulfodiicoccus acidiphilus]GGT99700.1 amidohydrolase [Sulfodiicoccus acidiphilus]